MQLLVKMTSALQKSKANVAVQLLQRNFPKIVARLPFSAAKLVACGMLQGWGSGGWGLGLAEWEAPRESSGTKSPKISAGDVKVARATRVAPR